MTLAAVIEQKVWVNTGSPLYPNLYVMIVGLAGTGKSRAINTSAGFVREIPELFLAPTSPTMAALAEFIGESKRTIINLPDPAVEYNSVYLVADELSALMAEYDKELVGGLTKFYDVEHYSRTRVTRDVKLKIDRPQLNTLIGATPSNVMKLIPEYAWEQGLMSRFIMVYSDEKPIVDIFNTPARKKPKELLSDLRSIFNLQGQMGWTEEYARAMHNWKLIGYDPVPDHPKLASYCARRFSHLIKLSMIASVDRGTDLTLTVEDFNRAMGWLFEAEANMPEIFRTGMMNADSKIMEEIAYFVKIRKTVGEDELIRFASELIPAKGIKDVLDIMTRTGAIRDTGKVYKGGLRIFTGNPTATIPNGRR